MHQRRSKKKYICSRFFFLISNRGEKFPGRKYIKNADETFSFRRLWWQSNKEIISKYLKLIKCSSVRERVFETMDYKEINIEYINIISIRP